MLAMSFTLLFLLIAMVVNISFLVTAKINLQNAVDLAAYAGAAQQARYLTEIGKWNYEMRRNYKAMVFDYLIVYNAERKKDDFKAYINNIVGNSPQQSVSPTVCSSLQRQNNSAPSPSNEEKICMQIPYDQFENAINQANTTAAQAAQAMIDACSSGSSAACAAYTDQFQQMLNNATKIYNTGTGYSGKYKNYENQDYNYNIRLMGWALHAYRQMQTRIRGVHYGHIRLQDRLNLSTDKNYTTVFSNSPIGIAAKVINGFTGTDDLDPTLKVQNNIIELDATNAVKNPVHNAAYTTFKNNLLKVLSSSTIKIFHIVPNSAVVSGFDARDMASGCSGATPTCNEYKGPYLRLQEHDVSFQLTYMTITNPVTGGGTLSVGMKPVTNFPVGVLKDDRVLTYYAVIGIADTKNVPFKVFYSGETNEAPSLVAVAAARPFGSRVGPYINNDCSDMFANNIKCEQNGRDPLYPTMANSAYPNFSIVERKRDSRNLGVKLSVDQKEYSLPTVIMNSTSSNPNEKVDLFAKTYGDNSRARYYTRKNSNYTKDDGFTALSTEQDYYENTAAPGPIPPQGNRNSIFAWNGTATATLPSGNQDDKDDFEAYLNQYKGDAIHQFTTDPNGSRKYKSSEYKLYVFRYPRSGPNGGNWDIDTLTQKTSATDYPNSMERAFANSMALSEFEIKRYIIPYTSSPSQDYLNYVADTNNKKGYVYAGETLRDIPGFGNKPFADVNGSTYAKMEKDDVLSNSGDFPDSYTSWRVGTRGYRVKLVNMQELVSGANSTIANPLPSKVTISGSGQDITIDLTKISY